MSAPVPAGFSPVLLLMIGLPGSGKSTLIKEMGWKPYTIEPDQLRLEHAGLSLDEEGNEMISQAENNKVWRLTEAGLKARLEAGKPVVLDATNVRNQNLRPILALAEKYQAPVYAVDMMRGCDLQTCLERQPARGFRQVPEEVIRRMHTFYQNLKLPETVKVFSPAQVREGALQKVLPPAEN